MKFTPLYDIHKELGGEMFTSSAGYRMPLHYKNPEDEHRAVRERVGMQDLSLMSRFDLKGKDALDVIQKLSVNDAGKLVDGQLMYTTMCDDYGNIVDDLTVWRFGPEHFRIVTSSIMRRKTYRWVEKYLRVNVSLTDISSGLGMISVQGLRSLDTLQKISDADLSKVKFFHFALTNLAEIPATVARVGFSGELGYECYFATEDTLDAWKAIAEAGKEYGIVPYGFDALDSLRYEKGYIFYGIEVTEGNNPYEVGLEKWISYKKGDFNGKEALFKIQEEGPRKRLMGLELEGDKILSASGRVKANGREIGETIVGFRGLTVGKNLAWAYLDGRDSVLGEQVTVSVNGNDTIAKIVSIRYYDPDGKRMKG